MRQTCLAILAALGCAAASASAASADHHPHQSILYRITVLPSLGGAVANSRGKSINDFGVVAG